MGASRKQLGYRSGQQEPLCEGKHLTVPVAKVTKSPTAAGQEFLNVQSLERVGNVLDEPWLSESILDQIKALEIYFAHAGGDLYRSCKLDKLSLHKQGPFEFISTPAKRASALLSSFHKIWRQRNSQASHLSGSPWARLASIPIQAVQVT